MDPPAPCPKCNRQMHEALFPGPEGKVRVEVKCECGHVACVEIVDAEGYVE